MFKGFKLHLMLVAHLFGVNVSIATIPMSILRLPRSIDCGGSLVNVWGLDYLCWINIHLYFLWPNMYGLFCFKTMDTWVRWNLESGNCFHSSEFLVLKPQNSLIGEIINRNILPLCGLVVSSRPHASVSLRKQATIKVHILGFTEEERSHYIEQSLKGQPRLTVVNHVAKNIKSTHLKNKYYVLLLAIYT